MNAPAVSPGDLPVSIARFTELFKSDVAEQMDVTWERVLAWLEAKPTKRWDEKCAGWSPVLYDPPRRARENVKTVYALVLDYDKRSTWDAVAALWGSFYGLIYTTKSHNIGEHRVRVVLPLSRQVNADEYGRLWQWAERRSKQADTQVDGQAKDASRFWYEPTLPDGDSWRAARLSGDPIDVDATLPLVELPRLAVVKMPPIVTTDARIERARRYLAKLPAAVAGNGGHTATFHAVATVMLGFDLDADTTMSLIASDYNPRCDPPWSERELLHKIQSVAKRCQRERGYLLKPEVPPIRTTQDAADQATPLDQEHDADWRTGCSYKKDGTFKRAYLNVERFVVYHPDWRGRFQINEMSSEIWFDGRPMRESIIHDIRCEAELKMGFTPPPSDVEAAIRKAAEFRPFHPVRDYLLKTCKWDGIERLASMARDFLGSDDPLHAEMLRRWMIGAVARALRPGCKLDTALMLFGDQGFGKSTFFAVLGGEWHADSFIDISNKDAFVQLHSAWLYELSELENVVTGRLESRLKAFLTSTHDMYRAPYAKAVERKPRCVAICGTTNRQQILTDDTGSRRFWIVPVRQRIDVETLREVRDQLWAEAVAAFEAGESWWLDADLEAQREAANENYADEDPWQQTVAAWLAAPNIRQVTVTDVLAGALDLDASRQDLFALRRVGKILRRLGWHRERETTGDRQWKFIHEDKF